MNGELSVTVADQVSVLIYAVAAGFAMGLYYDFFRTVRMIVHCSKTAVMLQDIFFWLSSAVVVFFVSIAVNTGYVRIYFIAAVLLSWALYFFTLGNAVMFIVNMILILVKRAASLTARYLIRPTTHFFNGFFMLISQKSSEILTHMTKNTKKHKKC